MQLLDTNGYYALGIPFYLTIIGVEIALARKQGLRVYRFADTLGNFSAGLGEIVIGLFLGPLLLWLYDFGYAQLALFHYAKGSPLPWILAFLCGDFCYYIYHRAGHAVAMLWAIHGVHHQSESFNVGVATRHPWLSDTYSFIFYVPLPLLGVPALHFFVAITIISFYALMVHSQVFRFPGFGILVTPASHIVHHARNPRYINRNFGAMFQIWDRLFGTHVNLDPQEPPIIGTVFGYQTHDGAYSQWVFFRDLIATARQVSSVKDRFRLFLRHPGWTPQGIAWPKHTAARNDGDIPNATRRHAVISFTATLLLAVYVLWWRDNHDVYVQLYTTAVLLWGLHTIGGLLDGRVGAARQDLIRLGFSLPAVALLAMEI